MSRLRQISIQRQGKLFILKGTEAWAKPADASMMLHDIFHHAPDDDGSMACEMMSFGTESWIDHHADQIRLGVGHESLCAVLEDVAEDPIKKRQREALFLDHPAPSHTPPDTPFIERFREIVTEAFTESSFSEPFSDVPDDVMSELCGDDNIGNYVSWMSYGFDQARERFPDPIATRELFNKMVKVLDRWAKTDIETLEIEIDEHAAAVRSDDAVITHILEDMRIPVASASRLSLKP